MRDELGYKWYPALGLGEKNKDFTMKDTQMISASYLSQFILSTSNGVDPMDQSKLTVGVSVSDCLSFR